VSIEPRRVRSTCVANDARARRPRATVLGAGLTPGSAAVLVGAVVTAFVVADAFVLAHRTVGWVVACAVVALLIDPVVDAVARVVPRWLAIVAVLLVILAIVATLVAGLVNDVINSLDELKENAPAAARSLEQRYSWARDLNLGQRVSDFVVDIDREVRRTTVSKALGTVPSYLVTGILMLFLLAYGRNYFDGFADQFTPERGERIRSVGREATSRGRRYLLVVVVESIANGVVVGTVCWLLDLPAAVSLGFAVGVMTVLPLIGVLVGGIPALLLAFSLPGWAAAVWVLLVLLGLQLIEAVVVRPAVDTRTVRVGPTVPIVVGLLGFDLYGVGGAVYGIALAVIGMAALDAIGRGRDDAPSAPVDREAPQE
jgi:predicted PurR-regulated permease PerM